MSTSEDHYVVLTADFEQEKSSGNVVLKKGEIHKVHDEYNPDEGYNRILINGKIVLVPTSITTKIINLQQQMCLKANAGGKKKRTKRNKRVKSRRRIKGKSVRRRK